MNKPTQIAKVLLRKWSVYANGYRWLCETFPEGAASYVDVQKALRAAGRNSDSG